MEREQNTEEENKRTEQEEKQQIQYSFGEKDRHDIPKEHFHINDVWDEYD